MYVVVVNIHVIEEHVPKFVAATRDNHIGTRGEPGNVRFDLVQRTDDPTRFVLYEVYREEADFAAHQRTPHYLSWKELVAPWMAEPRQPQKGSSVLPDPWH